MDACGSMYPVTIHGQFEDNAAPVITSPDITVTSCSPVAVNFTATIQDACDQNPTVTYSIASGSVFNPGSTPVTITATDNLGHVATQTFNVNVVPPTLHLDIASTSPCAGGDLSLSVSSVSGASYLWSGPNGFTSTEQNPSITNAQASNSGNYAVVITSGICAYNESVVATVKENPIVSAGADVTFCEPVQLNAVVQDNAPAAQGSFEVVVYDAPGGHGFGEFSTDLCHDGYNFISSAVSSAPFVINGASNITSINFKAFWTCSTGSWNVLLNGVFVGTSGDLYNTDCTCNPSSATYPGVFSISGSQINANWNANGNNVITVVPNYPGASAVAGFVAEVNYNNSASYAWSPAAGLSDAAVANPIANPENTTSYVLTYTSANGCSASDEIVVTKQCCVPASIEAVSNVAVNTENAVCSAVVNYSTVVAGTNPSVSYSFSGATVAAGEGNGSGSVFNVGETTVEVTVTNDCGTATTSFIVSVTDVTAPVVATQNVTVQLDANGQASITADQVNNGSSDACGIASVSVNQTSFDCSNVGANTVVLTVVDVNGNSASAEATVTVEDNIAPSIVCGGDVVVNAERNDCTPVVTWNAPVANDNCSFTVSSSHQSGDRFAVGTTQVTYTVTDASGNANSCKFNVVVNASPLVSSTSVKSYVGGNNVSCKGSKDGEASVVVEGGCLPYSYVWNSSPVQTSATATGLAAGTYTVTITDANNQTTTATVTLTEPAALVAEAGNNATVYYGYTPSSCSNLAGSAVGGTTAYAYSWSNGANSANTTVCPNATTVYTLTVTDANGCVATDKVTICAIDVRCEKGGNAIIKGQGNKVMICHNASGKFQTLCVAAEAVPAHLAHGDKLGECGVNASCFSSNKTDENADVSFEHVEESTVVAYPNPFTSTSTIEFTAAVDGNVLVQVVDMKGAVFANLYNGNAVEHQVYRFTVDGSSMQDGIYFVRVISNDQVQNVKLVLTK